MAKKSDIFAEFAEPTTATTEESVETFEGYSADSTIPSTFPTLSMPYRIAIIDYAPDKDSTAEGVAFKGQTGKLVTGLLSRASILREACFFSYIRTPTLASDLSTFNPHIVILMGDTALSLAKSGVSLDTYRGSLFLSDRQGPFFGRKCIATYNAIHIWRAYGDIAYLWFDILKAKAHAFQRELVLPNRALSANPTYETLIDSLQRTASATATISLDIEGYWNNISCLSIADSADNSYIIPFMCLDGSSFWTLDEEVEIWTLVVRILTNPAIPKVWQNGLYDRFCLQYGYHIPISGNVDDTMLKFWEKWCELEKGLGSQASILTDEPYYKAERKSLTSEDFYRYCCKDSAITFEINEKLKSKLSPSQHKHYELNHALLNPILYMELRGIRYDKDLAAERLKVIQDLIYSNQAELDALAGMGIGGTQQSNGRVISSSKRPGLFDTFAEESVTSVETNSPPTKLALKAKVQSAMCYVRNPEQPKADFAEDYYKVMAILNSPNPLTSHEIGFINIACKWSLNVDSPKQIKEYLYKTLKLPEQKVKKKVNGVYTQSTTADFLALLQLKKYIKKENLQGGLEDRVVDLVMEIGLLSTRASSLTARTDPDGRMRAGYNLVGSETGRLACYESPTGSGFNLQTVTKGISTKPKDHPLRLGMRDHFKADKGYHLFQCDLAGADGWTVGAHLARLGDPTMLDDLRFGLKPAAIICYMARHGNHSLNGLTREQIKPLLKEVKSEDWDYFAYKQCIWGLCYTMGPDKQILTVAKKSAGAIWLTKEQINNFRDAVFARYDVHRWHRYTQQQLYKTPEITAASGHVRKFWGRPTEILGQALAHEPQANTTYATNLAVYRLWTDVDNRIIQTSGGRNRTTLRIEPLHQVHDALIGQFRIEDTQWAVDKIRSYFNNEIIIAGTRITIPYDGAYGDNWGYLEAGVIK